MKFKINKIEKIYIDDIKDINISTQTDVDKNIIKKEFNKKLDKNELNIIINFYNNDLDYSLVENNNKNKDLEINETTFFQSNRDLSKIESNIEDINKNINKNQDFQFKLRINKEKEIKNKIKNDTKLSICFIDNNLIQIIDKQTYFIKNIFLKYLTLFILKMNIKKKILLYLDVKIIEKIQFLEKV